MKKEKITKIFIIIIALVVFSYTLHYWLSTRYEKQKEFFVNSCVNTFYYDDGFEFNKIVNDFKEELPLNIQNYIEKEFLGTGGYLAYIETKNIESLCKNIFDFYKEDIYE